MRFLLLAVWVSCGLAPAAARPAPLTEPLTFRKLRDYIRDNRLTRIPQVLRALPESYRSAFNLVYQSESQQGASRRYPRVILHGTTAKFLLAFNGSRKHAGYFTLETMEFLDDSDEFELHSITFDDPRRGRPGEPDYSDANPNDCLHCHTERPRPNWETYAFWRGVYQSDAHASAAGSPLNVPPHELRALQRFIARAPRHPRYRTLVNLDRKYRHVPADQLRNYDDTDYQPPTYLSQELGRLNGRRIARLLQDTDDYARYRLALLGALHECPDLPGFLPPAVRTRLRRPYADVLRDTVALLARHGNDLETTSGTIARDIAAGLRYLLEGRDIVIDDWSMNFRGHSYGYMGPRLSNEFRAFGILHPLYARDPKLRAVAERLGLPYGDSCAALSRESLAAFAIADGASAR